MALRNSGLCKKAKQSCSFEFTPLSEAMWLSDECSSTCVICNAPFSTVHRRVRRKERVPQCCACLFSHARQTLFVVDVCYCARLTVSILTDDLQTTAPLSSMWTVDLQEVLLSTHGTSPHLHQLPLFSVVGVSNRE